MLFTENLGVNTHVCEKFEMFELMDIRLRSIIDIFILLVFSCDLLRLNVWVFEIFRAYSNHVTCFGFVHVLRTN